MAKKLNILLYGETGTGKSIRAAAAAEFGTVYVFDFDQKFDSITHYYNDRLDLLAKIDYDTYADNPSEPSACTRAYKKLKDFWSECKAGEAPYDTVVWDSWTEWEQINLRQIMATNPGFNRMKVDTGVTSVTVPDRADYRIHAHLQQTFIPQLLSLPMNVIVISHVATRIDETTGAIDRGIAAAGKLTKVMPKYFGEVHRHFVKDNKYLVQVRSNSQFNANTRLKIGVPENGIIDGSLNRFESMMMKKGKETNE